MKIKLVKSSSSSTKNNYRNHGWLYNVRRYFIDSSKLLVNIFCCLVVSNQLFTFRMIFSCCIVWYTYFNFDYLSFNGKIRNCWPYEAWLLFNLGSIMPFRRLSLTQFYPLHFLIYQLYWNFQVQYKKTCAPFLCFVFSYRDF